MVVHLCCGVDAGYFLKRLKEEFPEERLIGYFFDPNIHPYSEFLLRSFETKRVCEKLGVEFVEGEYLVEEWFQQVKGLEQEPEKGERCSRCFDFSLEKSALLARQLGERRVTTSLLMSPMKSREQLKRVGEVLREKYQVELLTPDFRKKGGTQAQQQLAREWELYRQDYCGCLFGLRKQKGEESLKELSSPVGGELTPASPEERLHLYQLRRWLEERRIPHRVIREEFLNYRLLRGGVEKGGKGVVPSFILPYSQLPRPVRGEVEFFKNGVGYFSKMGALLVELERFNQIGGFQFKSVSQLYRHPPSFEKQLDIRRKLEKRSYSTSPIFILDRVEMGIRYRLEVESLLFPDHQFHLLLNL
ncbi:MAG: epoxyqueuosine reductase QueH [Campylobacterales bacterium]